MNNVTFFFQFVHYSNKELSELKNLVYNNIPKSSVHLISNKNLSVDFGINNSVGRVIFIKKNNIKFSEILNMFSLLDPIVNTYSQLNLFIVKINKLFLNINLAHKYLNHIEKKEVNPLNNLRNVTLFNYFYLVNWLYINMYHQKVNILFNNINISSINTDSMYSMDYL